LATNRYGKKKVRFLRVVRDTPTHEAHELNVEILLESPELTTAYTQGDNSYVLPTESQKNTIYFLSKKYHVDPVEKWVIEVADDFLRRNSHLNAINLAVDKQPWERVQLGKDRFHNHVFTLGAGIRFARYRKERDGACSLFSGFRDLTIMKTAQSGFTGYIKDEFTTLRETTDRIMSTQIYCEWEYRKDVNLMSIEYNSMFESIRNLTISIFAGEPKEGVYSASVQHTIYMMATTILETHPQLERITYKLPNIHYYMVNFNDFKTDLVNNNEVFHTYDGAHGQIEATFERKKSKL